MSRSTAPAGNTLAPPSHLLVPTAVGPPAPRDPLGDRVGAGSPSQAAHDVVVCSFFTPDGYYSGHARELSKQLEGLGLAHVLLEAGMGKGEDWADVTRRKIGFVRQMCREYPDAMVFWMDVDCRLLSLPAYVRASSADFIGFQRSFRSPLHIGYHSRSRFWEPSFWGVNSTLPGRKLIDDAFALEQRSTLKATDDYFLEEAWRANARNLSFQIIPSTAVVAPHRGGESDRREAFFQFGSSGHVAEFQGRVAQHSADKTKAGPRKKALAKAKKLEAALPDGVRGPIRRVADSMGVTDVLTADSAPGLDPQRAKALKLLLRAAKEGDRDAHRAAVLEFDNKYVSTAAEQATMAIADAFLDYSDGATSSSIRLSWWSKPYPGNFGDWLSPLVVADASDSPIRLQPVTKPTKKPHLTAVGSIGRFIRSSSVVVGTGISSTDVQLSRKAHYVSVRGPITAAVLRQSGGPDVEQFGDPAVLLSRIIPASRGQTNGRLALVRHFSHLDVPIRLPEHVDELSVLMSRRADVEAFLRSLASYDAVLTSTLHVMIACQSYGIPCGLVGFEGFEHTVHGQGIKYEDYALGAGVAVLNPKVVPPDLTDRDLDSLIVDIRVSEATKDQVQAQLAAAVTLVTDRASKSLAR